MTSGGGGCSQEGTIAEEFAPSRLHSAILRVWNGSPSCNARARPFQRRCPRDSDGNGSWADELAARQPRGAACEKPASCDKRQHAGCRLGHGQRREAAHAGAVNGLDTGNVIWKQLTGAETAEAVEDPVHVRTDDIGVVEADDVADFVNRCP